MLIIFENLTCKTLNCSLYNEGVLSTMSLLYFSVVKRKDRNTITNYDRNRKLYDIQKRELVLSICKTLRLCCVYRNLQPFPHGIPLKFKSFVHSPLGFTDQGKYTDGVQNVRNYSLTLPKVNYSADNPSLKLISSDEQSHTTRHGERLLHYSLTYIYVQTNKFVCLLGNKNSFDGFIGLPVLFRFLFFFFFWVFVCFI